MLKAIKSYVQAYGVADNGDLAWLMPFAELFAESQDGQKKEHARNAINEAFTQFEAIATKHPESRELLAGAVAKLINVAAESLLMLHRKNARREHSSITPLAEQNAAKSAAVKRAQAIATELWQADTAQEIRLGDMAEQVYRALAGEGFTESLPGTAERIKEWIKPVAPDYARKGGRRRKTP